MSRHPTAAFGMLAATIASMKRHGVSVFVFPKVILGVPRTMQLAIADAVTDGDLVVALVPHAAKVPKRLVSVIDLIVEIDPNEDTYDDAAVKVATAVADLLLDRQLLAEAEGEL